MVPSPPLPDIRGRLPAAARPGGAGREPSGGHRATSSAIPASRRHAPTAPSSRCPTGNLRPAAGHARARVVTPSGELPAAGIRMRTLRGLPTGARNGRASGAAGRPAWQGAADVLAAFLHTVPVGCFIPDGNPKP